MVFQVLPRGKPAQSLHAAVHALDPPPGLPCTFTCLVGYAVSVESCYCCVVNVHVALLCVVHCFALEWVVSLHVV